MLQKVFIIILSLIIKKQILAKYNKIITYANNSGFNVSKDIHELEIGDESYYYVTHP